MSLAQNDSRGSVLSSGDELLRAVDVARRLQVTPKAIYAWISAGSFPRPIYISSRSPRWTRAMIDAFIASRISAAKN